MMIIILINGYTCNRDLHPQKLSIIASLLWCCRAAELRVYFGLDFSATSTFSLDKIPHFFSFSSSCCRSCTDSRHASLHVFSSLHSSVLHSAVSYSEVSE